MECQEKIIMAELSSGLAILMHHSWDKDAGGMVTNIIIGNILCAVFLTLCLMREQGQDQQQD